MGLSRTYILAVVVLCQMVGYGLTQEVNLLSFGDFMEFHIGLHKACENARGGPNTTFEIIESFAKCTRALEQPQDKDLFDVHMSICKNGKKYFECWDKMKAETLKQCGADKGALLPTVYQGTAASVCGNDNGAAKLSAVRSASDKAPPQHNCSEDGRHWIEQCQELLPNMHSSDLCARHAAISTCLNRISCPAVPQAALTNKLYADGRAALNCNKG